jgi:hypothetical protein
MKYHKLSATALVACMFITGSAFAQELPDLNAVPKQMPFNFPFGTPISLREAQALIRPTMSFETGVQKYGFNYLLSFDDIIAVGGGIPLVQNGKIVGAIGCSGATTSQDEVLCQAAVGPPYMKSFSTLGN